MFKLALGFVSIAFTLQGVVCRPSVEAPTPPAIGGTNGRVLGPSRAFGGFFGPGPVIAPLESREVQDEDVEADAAEFIGFHGTNSVRHYSHLFPT